VAFGVFGKATSVFGEAATGATVDAITNVGAITNNAPTFDSTERQSLDLFALEANEG
jgi:hypothetical protein